MTFKKTPVLRINRETVGYIPNTLKYQKGNAERKFFPDTLKEVHITEDLSTAVGMVSFELRSLPKFEKSFNRWIANGDNNVLTVVEDDLVKNFSNYAIENTNEEIESGSESTFAVVFKGKPVVE